MTGAEKLKSLVQAGRGYATPLWQTPVDFWRGYRYGRGFAVSTTPPAEPDPTNWLEQYFDDLTEGPGLWKWRHYFPVYDRHFAKFRGKEVHILEIGIFSGGSLGMWHSYFGDNAHVYGVDIEPACRAYENDRTRVFIGDQSDKSFWQQVIAEVPRLDIVVDDGGHMPYQQIATLEALLPHLQPGGVYFCEDVHGPANAFHSYVQGLSRSLYAMDVAGEDGMLVNANGLQNAVDSVHEYPFVTVIERRTSRLSQLHAPKHGTEWQPFLATKGVKIPD